jgi:ABC-type sugar transport system permease subunit
VVDLLVTILTIVVVLVAAAIVFVALNRLVDLLSIEWQDRVRPWVFILPALVFLGVGLVYPTLRTVYLSFRAGRNGGDGWTFDNYTNILSDHRNLDLTNWTGIFSSRLFFLAALLFFGAVAYVAVAKSRNRQAGTEYTAPVPSIAVVAAAVMLLLAVFSTLTGTIVNNLWWVVTVAGLSTLLGLMMAILADRARGEKVAKSLIFMPGAISFVGAAIIWRYVYYRNTSREDIGLLNNVLTSTGILDEPIDFYTSADIIPWNNFFIMIIMIWIQIGFALVVCSAAVKAVPSETLEAARIDGASELQQIWRVVIPQVWPTVVVVLTTITVTVMKVFDLVKATTNGRSNTDVLANSMYENLRDSNFTVSATFAMIIVVLVLPIIYVNVRRHRQAVG